MSSPRFRRCKALKSWSFKAACGLPAQKCFWRSPSRRRCFSFCSDWRPGQVFLQSRLRVRLRPLRSILFLLRARRRRIAAFSEQFPDALDVIARGLRAGHPFRVAIGLVAREMPDPVGSEFGIVADEITFGLEQSIAVDNLGPRVGHNDLSFFSTAVNIQHQTGGNLAEILSRLSRMLRSRLKLRLKIRALSS